jgi:glycylpeptide N-tetradecanoyltransferase
LPKDFEWVLVDIKDEKDLKDTYELLSLNYVEDTESAFRFDYSAAFLKWALQPPGWKPEWHLGVRVVKTKKLVGFIAGTPADMRVYGNQIHLVEINFLCVHKKLRSKRLAPVLIKEITRRVQLFGIFQAVYTAGILLPKPLTSCRYYHRTMQAKKLVDVGFSYIGRNDTLAKMIKRLKITTPKIQGWRQMEEKDVNQITKLLAKYHKRFEFTPELSEEDVKHYLLPIDGVVESFVIENEKSEITDFVSYYHLNSTIIGNVNYSHVNAAYLYYYVPMGLGEDLDRLNNVIHDALVFAKEVIIINNSQNVTYSIA